MLKNKHIEHSRRARRLNELEIKCAQAWKDVKLCEQELENAKSHAARMEKELKAEKASIN